MYRKKEFIDLGLSKKKSALQMLSNRLGIAFLKASSQKDAKKTAEIEKERAVFTHVLKVIKKKSLTCSFKKADHTPEFTDEIKLVAKEKGLDVYDMDKIILFSRPKE